MTLIRQPIQRLCKDGGQAGSRAGGRLLAVMCAGMTLGYMPWYALSAVSPGLSREYGLSAADLALALAALQAGYVVAVPFVGWLGDRVGLKRTVVVATAVTGVASSLLALGTWGKAALLGARLVTGVAAAAIYVPGLALLSQRYPPARRGAVLGAYTGALVFAYAGGYFVASPVGAAFGWRAGLLAASLPAVLAAVMLQLMVPGGGESRAGIGAAHQAGQVGPRSPSGRPVPVALVALLNLGYAGHMWEQYAFWGWVGPFMVSALAARGMAEAQAASIGGLAASCVILLGVPATIAVGAFADRVGKARCIVLASCCSFVAIGSLGYLRGAPLWAMLAVAAWAGFWVVADSALYKAVLLDWAPPGRYGTWLGLQSAAGFGVTVVSPLAFSRFLGVGPGGGTGAALGAGGAWGPAFAVLAGGGAVAAAALTGQMALTTRTGLGPGGGPERRREVT